MILEIDFKEIRREINADFGEVHNISDGGFERGYAEGETKGYEKGYTEGEVKGFADGETVGYNKGYADGETVSYDKGHADGVKSEYDRFWDEFQLNGNRTNYTCAFTNAWNDEIFKPKYDLNPINCQQMFQSSSVVDLKGCLEKQGVILDTSQSTMLLQMFQSSKVKYLPTIDASKSTNNSYAFLSSSLISIEKLILSETTHYSVAMFNCVNLEHLIVDGVIDRSGFNVSTCKKLSHESLMSIINILKDYSGTSETRTCTLGATNLAKLTDTEKAIATEKGWTLA